MDINYFGITDAGKIRENNEDTFIAEKISGEHLILACVIDGVGGYSGGEIASAIARKSILQHFNLPNADFPALMTDAIIAADEQIMAEKKRVPGHENMACVLTLVVADLSKNQFYYSHVGDTRLYLLRDNSLVKISKDQSFVGFMEDSGRLTEEQAMRHPKRNEINKALGFGVNIATQNDYLESGKSPFLPGDILLICSDGLSDMVSSREIREILTGAGSLEDKGKQLIDTANRNGGLDNITVALVKNDKQAQIHEVAKPAPTVRESIPEKKTPAVNTSSLEPAVSDLPEKKITPGPDIKKSNSTTILSILCFLLLIAVAYLLWQSYNNDVNSTKQQKLSTIKPPRNPQEKKLQDTLNKLSGNMLILTDSLFKSPILITEPLQFNKDTIYLIAEKGITIAPDSSFNSIPVIVRPTSKHVLLENFTFQNFNTVISSQSNAVVFKNIRFINCPNAMQIIYNFPSGKYINGKLPHSIFKADSLPIQVNN